MDLKLTEHSSQRTRAFAVLATVGWVILALTSASVQALDVGNSAPTFSLSSNRGKLDSTSLKGRLVYVDFWASWCVPCKQSFPWMNEMQAKYADRGLHVLAINVDAKAADAEKFLTQVPAKFQVAFDSSGETPKQFAVKSMPSSYLIDGDGRAVYVHTGFRESDKKTIEAAILAALDNMKKR